MSFKTATVAVLLWSLLKIHEHQKNTVWLKQTNYNVKMSNASELNYTLLSKHHCNELTDRPVSGHLIACQRTVVVPQVSTTEVSIASRPRRMTRLTVGTRCVWRSRVGTACRQRQSCDNSTSSSILIIKLGNTELWISYYAMLNDRVRPLLQSFTVTSVPMDCCMLCRRVRSLDVDRMKWLTVVDSGVTLGRTSMLTVLRQQSYGDRSGLFWLLGPCAAECRLWRPGFSDTTDT